jgi:phage tail P2-like protein
MARELQDVTLLDILPGSIAHDEDVQAAASALGVAMSDVERDISLAYLFSRIDTLPEDVLDHLGYQFHITGIEGWRLAATVAEKRNLVRTAIEIHRKKGTKYAVVRVLDLLGMRGVVSEWFEYGGNPYTFKIDIDVVGYPITTEVLALLDDLVGEYKSARSHYEVDLGLAQRSKIYLPAWMQTGHVDTLYPGIAGALAVTTPVYHGQGYHTWDIVRLFPEAT